MGTNVGLIPSGASLEFELIRGNIGVAGLNETPEGGYRMQKSIAAEIQHQHRRRQLKQQYPNHLFQSVNTKRLHLKKRRLLSVQRGCARGCRRSIAPPATVAPDPVSGAKRPCQQADWQQPRRSEAAGQSGAVPRYHHTGSWR
ncbi:unnamed protein product [Arctogadus glacialis]